MYFYCVHGHNLANVALLYVVEESQADNTVQLHLSLFISVAAGVQRIDLNLQPFYTDDFRFCDRHGPKSQVNKPSAPSDLMCVAEAVMPRIILRLIQHLREHRYWHIPSFHVICDTAFRNFIFYVLILLQ